MPPSADRLFSAKVKINGKEKPELYNCSQTIRVEEDIERGSSFNLVMSLCRNDDGSWPHLDDDEMTAWNRVTVTVTVGSQTDTIMDGYISDIHIETVEQTAQLKATFTGVDASYVMNLEPHCHVWNDGKTYEEIAQTIITGPPYNMAAMVADPPSSSSSPPPSVTQRQTDLQFLRELARRRGYEFYVLGGTAYFRAPVLDGTPQRQIATNFGERTNCENVQMFVNGTAPTEVVGARVDRETGETVTGRATSTDTAQTAMGTTDVSDQRGYGVPATRMVVRRAAAGNEAELTAYLRGVMSTRTFWVKVTGTLNALRYGAVLRIRKLVSIVGIGARYNGNFYVRKVVHTITPRTYRMEFEAVKNRLGEAAPTDVSGLEDPSSSSAPMAAGAGADTDVVTVRDSGAQVAPA
jgi:phage protein D